MFIDHVVLRLWLTVYIMSESHIVTLALVFRLSKVDTLANVYGHHHIIREAISNTQLSNL